jgi:hypothetical protein
MRDLLRQTLELYTETWKKDHDTVMQKYQRADSLAALARFGIFLFDELVEALREGASDSFEGVRCNQKAFNNWYRVASSVVTEIELLESEKFQVELADDLRDRQMRSTEILQELADAMTAISAVQNGRALSAESYINELRGQVHG